MRFVSSRECYMYGFLAPIGGGDPFPLTKKEMVIGRHKSCDIVLNFGNVSSQHCKLVLSEGYWYIIDLHSTNGVKVNGTKVTDRRVDPGVVLTISKHQFKVQYSPRQLGASGLPPSDVLNNDILSQSLMQRAGLEKTQAVETVADESLELEPILSTPIPTIPKVPLDFFPELVFD